MIKLFIFDMGGVLTQNFNILPEAAEIMGMSYQDLLGYIKEDLVALMEGVLSTKNFWKNLSGNCNITISREFWSELFKPSIDKDTERIIKKIKKTHRVVCGTNTIAEHFNIHENRGDYNVFDRVYASHIMGIAKPKPEFYKLILDEEGFKPENVVFVDDFTENIETARALGINSFLFKNAVTFLEELNGAGLYFD